MQLKLPLPCGTLSFSSQRSRPAKCKVQIIKQEVFLMISQPQPSVNPKLEEPKFGFNEYAERLNGRAAMIGFVIMVVIEYVTHKGVLAWLGLN
jgi:Chlorophyll A-B binding protein